MNYERFYHRLFKPLEADIGPMDREMIFHIMGFDGAGLLNFGTIGAKDGTAFVTYVSCELSPRPEQIPSSFGRYELLVTCNDERWVRRVVSDVGHMSLNEAFDHGHTVDIGQTIDAAEPIQGVLFEKMYDVKIDGANYGILRCIGITRAEMEHKQAHGFQSLFRLLKEGGVYPRTDIRRNSVV